MKRICALVCGALAMAASAQAAASQDRLAPRDQLILQTLDANGDGMISCEELAAFLDPIVVKTLRAQGIEPRVTSSVSPCGARQVPGPAPDATEPRAPDKNYAEFLRGLIRSALNTATSVSDSDDAVAPGEIAELTQASLPAPLAGTFSDLLPRTPGANGPAAEAWTDTLEKWVNIRQSFLDEQGIGKPAKISLTDHGQHDETLDAGDPSRVYQVKAAVVMAPQFEWAVWRNVYIRPVAAYEVDISSDAPEKDQIVHRVGISSVIVRNDSAAAFSSHLVDLTFDYSTNRGYKASVYGATLQYTPNYRRIGIGQYLAHGALVDFRWRPYIGVVWSHVSDADDVVAYQKEKNFAHEFVRVTGELKVTDRIKVTPEAKLWRADRTTADGQLNQWQTLRSLESRVVLSQSSKGVDRASLALTFTDGRDEPAFLNEQTTVVSLAVKF
jgi:hypothetical protein